MLRRRPPTTHRPITTCGPRANPASRSGCSTRMVWRSPALTGSFSTRARAAWWTAKGWSLPGATAARARPSSSRRMERVMQFDHVAVPSSDIAESVRWYTERFGAEVLYQDATWAFMLVGGTKLALV